MERLWAALGGDPARAGDVQVSAAGRYLPSAFDVDGLAVGAVSCALLAAAELAEARGAPRPRVELDARHVACAFASERHLRRGGASAGPGFALLSRFAATRDGWIRLHANYDHYRRALLSALETDADHALDAIAQRDAACRVRSSGCGEVWGAERRAVRAAGGADSANVGRGCRRAAVRGVCLKETGKRRSAHHEGAVDDVCGVVAPSAPRSSPTTFAARPSSSVSAV